MKRFLAILIALTLLVSCGAGCLAEACENHKMGPWKTYGSCTGEGVKYRYCEHCSYFESQKIGALGHWYPDPWETLKEPTCTEPGQEQNFCKRVVDNVAQGVYYCNNQWIREIPALGHDWDDWYIAQLPTLEVDGYEERCCARCGITETRPLTLDGEAPAEYWLTLTEVSSPENGEYYTPGDEVEFELVLVVDTPDPAVDIYLYAAIGGEEKLICEETELEIYSGGTGSKFKRFVNDDDADNGFLTATGSCLFTCKVNGKTYALTAEPLTVKCGYAEGEEIGDMEIAIEKTVLSEPANGKYYLPGETVSYGITVYNCQDETYYDLEVSDPLKGGNEDAILLIEPVVAPHAVYELGFDYVVTEEDAAVGYIDNTATARWFEEGEEESFNIDSETVTVFTGRERQSDAVTVYKKAISVPVNGKYFVPGEQIEYEIQTHLPDKQFEFVSVNDMLSGENYNFEGVSGQLFAYYDIEGNTTLTDGFIYTVTEEDAQFGYIVNQAVVICRDAEDNNYYMLSNTVYVPTGYPDGEYEEGDAPLPESALQVVKEVTSIPTNGEYYVPGEEAYYRITVRPTAEGTVYNVFLYDTLLEDGVCLGEIAPDEEVEVFYIYTVTDEDAQNGAVFNRAWVTFENVIGDEASAQSEETVIYCGEDLPINNGIVYLDKYLNNAPANGSFFTEGEIVEFTLKWGSQYEGDVYDVEVVDHDYHMSVGTMSGGEVGEDIYQYVVTAEDAQNGSFTNQGFIMWGEEPGVQDMVSYSDIVTVPTGIEEPYKYTDVTVTKIEVSAPADGYAYKEGEWVNYLLILSNNGTQPVYNAELWDKYWTISGGDSVLLSVTAQLDPGQSVTANFSHQVTEWDCLDGAIHNIGTVNYIPEDGLVNGFACSETVTVLTQPGFPPIRTGDDPEFGVYKYEASVPKNHMYYEEGETVQFIVVAYNYSGVTFKNVNGYDILLDTPGFYFGSMAELGAEPAIMNVSYQVTNIDVLLGSVSNIAWVEATDPDGNVHTVFSNEVTVPVGKKGDPYPDPKGGKDSCEIYVTGRGEGVIVIKTDYCAEHALVDEAVCGILAAAETDEQKTAALNNAENLWRTALEVEYDRLLAEADEELKQVVLREKACADAEYETRIAFAESCGAFGEEEIALLKMRILRARTCELCAARAAYHGSVPEKPEAAAVSGGDPENCVVKPEDGSGWNIETIVMCRLHSISDKAALRLENALGLADEETAADVREKILACRRKDLNAAVESALKTGAIATVPTMMKEKIALNRYTPIYEAMIRMLYAEYPETAEEIIARNALKQTAFLCGAK